MENGACDATIGWETKTGDMGCSREEKIMSSSSFCPVGDGVREKRGVCVSRTITPVFSFPRNARREQPNDSFKKEIQSSWQLWTERN